MQRLMEQTAGNLPTPVRPPTAGEALITMANGVSEHSQLVLEHAAKKLNVLVRPLSATGNAEKEQCCPNYPPFQLELENILRRIDSNLNLIDDWIERVDI